MTAPTVRKIITMSSRMLRRCSLKHLDREADYRAAGEKPRPASRRRIAASQYRPAAGRTAGYSGSGSHHAGNGTAGNRLRLVLKRETFFNPALTPVANSVLVHAQEACGGTILRRGIVRQQDRDGFVADQIPGAPDGMTETKWVWLPR